MPALFSNKALKVEWRDDSSADALLCRPVEPIADFLRLVRDDDAVAHRPRSSSY